MQKKKNKNPTPSFPLCLFFFLPSFLLPRRQQAVAVCVINQNLSNRFYSCAARKRGERFGKGRRKPRAVWWDWSCSCSRLCQLKEQFFCFFIIQSLPITPPPPPPPPPPSLTQQCQGRSRGHYLYTKDATMLIARCLKQIAGPPVT